MLSLRLLQRYLQLNCEIEGTIKIESFLTKTDKLLHTRKSKQQNRF